MHANVPAAAHDDGFAADASPAPAAQKLLRLFHAAVPGSAGVILATPDGAPVAHDLSPGFDPSEAVESAVATLAPHAAPDEDEEREPASAFVDTVYGRTLVVFVQPGFAMHAGLYPAFEDEEDADDMGDAPTLEA